MASAQSAAGPNGGTNIAAKKSVSSPDCKPNKTEIARALQQGNSSI
jgi:hypothetical protein